MAKLKRPTRIIQEEDDDDTGVVFVACKMPNGIELCTYVMQEQTEVTLGGSRQIKLAQPSKLPRVRLAGYAAPAGMAPRCEVVYGFAITRNVPAKVWNMWYEQNKTDSDMIANGIIFADRDYGNVKAFCREHEKLNSGFEAINPAGDPRMPKTIKPWNKDDFSGNTIQGGVTTLTA